MDIPRVFNIPASAPFLRTLIAALLDGRLVPGFPGADDPLALASATLYLPTRRGCRLARDTFLDVIAGDAAILPRIVPIGDVDEDEIAFAEIAGAQNAEQALELPEALGGLERRLLLARLVAQWAASPAIRLQNHAPLVASTPAAALALAADLARLMDDMTTRQVPWQRLDELVPDNTDEYWQLTLNFLKIARDVWPGILKEHGKIEPAARRDMLIEAEAARLKTDNAPVVAAGSTGSMPATAKLLETIAKLPHGAVVLPGLDTDLDEAAWSAIGDERDSAAGHPQFAMHGLLRRIGINRGDVAALAAPAPYGRERLVSEALRPAQASDTWQKRIAEDAFAAHADNALATLSLIEAANAEDESLAIAVALREMVQKPGKTAALVTPDRALARRVLAALARWNVSVDDSGGDRLGETPPGIFARLVADAALGELAPVTLLALLKHPLLQLDADSDAVGILEFAILRGPRPRPGSAGLAHTLQTLRETRHTLHWCDPRRDISDQQLDRAAGLVAKLGTALRPLEELGRGSHSFAEIAKRHLAALDMLIEDQQRIAKVAEILEEITGSEAAKSLAVTSGDYAELFHAAISDRTVRRPEFNDVRVRIYGPLEARLQQVDRLILGGLVEGTWPPETRTDPWLNRPMRQALGLDLPERRIGLSAHDFAQAMGAAEIFITRPAKLAGTPTIASRFVQRLAAVAGEAHWNDAKERGEKYLDWARRLDAPIGPPRPCEQPEPKPPRETRPTSLSVTEIEHWLRDPYTIYARHILRLQPLDAVDTPPGAADRGTLIHAAIAEFSEQYAAKLPDDPYGELVAIGDRHFRALDDFPEARAFWWPRFLRIARWFSDFENERRANAVTIFTEKRGALEIPLGERVFTLRARADRIERLASGGFAVLDYKTGQPPSEKQVRSGLSPQLTLEAAILLHGKFQDIEATAPIAELVYVHLKGGDLAGEKRRIEFKEGDPNSHAERAYLKLAELAAHFDNTDTPYRSLVSPMWKTRYGDYDHLARVKEWSLGGSNGEGEE